MEHKRRSSLRKHVVANKGNQQSTTKRRISFNSRKSVREFNQEQKETLDYDISDRSDPYAEDASYKHINKVTSTSHIMDSKTGGVIHMKPKAEVKAGNESLEYINQPIQNTVLNIEYSVDVTLFDDEPRPRNRYSENLLKKSLLNEPNTCEGDKFQSEIVSAAATTINEHKADHLSKSNQQSEKLPLIVRSLSENLQSLPPPPKVATMDCVEAMNISPSSDTEIKCKDNTRTSYNKTKVTIRQICLPSPALKSLAPVNQRLLAYYKSKQKDKMSEEMNITPAEPSSPINEVKKSLNFSFSTRGNESLPLYPPDVNITNLRQLNDDLESGKLQLFAEAKARALPENKSQYNKYRCRFSQADDLMLDNTSFLTQAKLGNESTLRNSSKKSLNGLEICDDTLFFTQPSFQDRFPVNTGGAGYLKGTVKTQEGNSESLNLESKPLEDAQDVTSYDLEMEIKEQSTGNNTKSRQTMILQEKIEGNIGEIQRIIKDRKARKDELYETNPKSRRTMILNEDIETETTKSAVRKEQSRESRRTMIFHENIEEDVLSKDKTIKATSTELPQVRITRRTQKANADSREVPQAKPMLRKTTIFNQDVKIESPTRKENNTRSTQTMQENMEEDIVKEVSQVNPKSRRTMILNHDIEPENTISAVLKEQSRESRRTMILQERIDEDIEEDAALLDDALSKHKEVSQENPKCRRTMILNHDIEPENTISAVLKEQSRESRRTMILQERIDEDIEEDAALLDDALSKHKEVSQENPKSRRTMILNQDIEPENTISAVLKEQSRESRRIMILQESIDEEIEEDAALLDDALSKHKEVSQENPKSCRTMILNQDIEPKNTISAVLKEQSRESRRTMILQERIDEDIEEDAALLDDALSKHKEVSQENPKSRRTMILNEDIEPENTISAVLKEQSRESRRIMILQESIDEKIEEDAALLDDVLSKHKEVSQENPKSRRTMILNQNIEPENIISAVLKEQSRESRRTMILQESIDEEIEEDAALLDDALSKHKEVSQENPKSCRTMILNQDIEPKNTISAVFKEQSRESRRTMILQERIDEDIEEDAALLDDALSKHKEVSQENPKSRRTMILNQGIEPETTNSAVRKENDRVGRSTMTLQENIGGDVFVRSVLLPPKHKTTNKEESEANLKSRKTMILNQDIESENTKSAVRKEHTLNDVEMEANAFEEQVLDKVSSVNKLFQSSCFTNDDQFRTPLKTSANQERLRKMCAITPRQSLLEFTRLEKTILKQSSTNYPTPLKDYHKTKINYSNITTFEDFDGSPDAKTTKSKPKPFKVEISGLELNDSVAGRTGIEQQQPPSQIMSYDMTGRISTLVGEAFDESQNNGSINVLRNVSTLNKWPDVKSLGLPSTSEESMEQRTRFDDNTISVLDVIKDFKEPSCSSISALPQIQCHTLNDSSIQFIEEEQLTLVDNINIEGDDDKEELIEEIKDESDSEDEQQQACGSIVNDGNNTTFLCRKCKRCQQTLTDETLISDKSESFVLPVVKPLISIGLEKLLRSRKKLKIADLDDLWRSLDDDIDSTQNITNVVEDETLMASSVDGVKDDFGTCETECGFIRGYRERMAKFEKEIKEKYDQLYKDPPLPVVESLKNKLSNNPKMSHWIFDYQLEICGLFMFVHRQLLTFKLKIIFNAICPLGTEIHIKTIKTCDRVKQSMWKPIDFILDFQLKLQIPSNVQTMCKGHDAESIYKMLEKLNQMIENAAKLGRELQIVTFKYDASLKTDGPNRYYIRKILRRVVKSPDTYDRVEKLEFQIDVYNIQALNFRNIVKPRLHNFQEDVQLLPTGIEFLNVFLSDPLKFIKPELKQSIFH